MLIWQVFHRFSSYDVAHVVRSESYWVLRTWSLDSISLIAIPSMYVSVLHKTKSRHQLAACLGLHLYIRSQLFCHPLFDTRDRIGTSIMILFHPYDITERIVVSDTSVIFMTDDLIWENHVISCYVFTIWPLTLSFILIVAFFVSWSRSSVAAPSSVIRKSSLLANNASWEGAMKAASKESW